MLWSNRCLLRLTGWPWLCESNPVIQLLLGSAREVCILAVRPVLTWRFLLFVQLLLLLNAVLYWQRRTAIFHRRFVGSWIQRRNAFIVFQIPVLVFHILLKYPAIEWGYMVSLYWSYNFVCALFVLPGRWQHSVPRCHRINQHLIYNPSTPAPATVVAGTFLAMKRQPLELESCSEHFVEKINIFPMCFP